MGSGFSSSSSSVTLTSAAIIAPVTVATSDVTDGVKKNRKYTVTPMKARHDDATFAKMTSRAGNIDANKNYIRTHSSSSDGLVVPAAARVTSPFMSSSLTSFASPPLKSASHSKLNYEFPSMTSSPRLRAPVASSPQPIPKPRKGAAVKRNLTFNSVPGHEQPHNIRLHQARNQLVKNDSASDAFPASLSDVDLNDTDVQFIVRENKKVPKKPSLGEFFPLFLVLITSRQCYMQL